MDCPARCYTRRGRTARGKERKDRSRTSVSNGSLGDLGRGTRMPLFAGSHAVEDGVYGGLVSHGGVDHQVEAMPIRPIHAEIAFDESGTVLVHGFGEMHGIGPAFAAG